MKSKTLGLLAAGLLVGSTAANAIDVQSSTGVRVTFRNCIPGITACDSVSPIVTETYDGNPGDVTAAAAQTEPAFGTASGSATLSGVAGAPMLSGYAESLPGTRNNSSSAGLQSYSYTGAGPTTRTFNWGLAYDQNIPDLSGTFPNPAATASGVFATLEIFTLTGDFLDAGATPQDNWATLFGGYTLAPGYTSLANMTFSDNDTNAAGKASLSLSLLLNPGQRYWVLAWLQTPSTNGAVVNAYTTSAGWDSIVDLTPANAVPESGTLALLGLGLLGLGLSRRRKSG